MSEMQMDWVSGVSEPSVASFSEAKRKQEDVILAKAREIVEKRMGRGERLKDPDTTRQYLQVKIAHLEYEVFGCIFLDARFRVIEVRDLFRGTVDGAAVPVREVVREAIAGNAVGVIFYHNHPSGIPEPSSSDRTITERLRQALSQIDIKTIDHFVIGAEGTVSFAERGYI